MQYRIKIRLSILQITAISICQVMHPEVHWMKKCGLMRTCSRKRMRNPFRQEFSFHVEGTPMDFRNAKTVEKEIGGDYIALRYGNGYDHNWVLNGEGFRKVAAAYSEKTGIKMEVSTDLPGMQFYSGNFLVETKGKDGAVYDKGHGICFETQYFPDAIHKDNFKSPVVRAGESYETTTIYKFV